MQVIVLAGGLATRLLPRTETIPKSLIEIRGRPFVAWQLERLARSGIESVVLCVSHLGEQIQHFVGDGREFGVRVEYSFDGPRLLGTAGALRRALALLEPTFLVTYGDSYLPFDYAGVLRDLDAHSAASGTMSVFANGGRWDASNVRVEGELVVRYEKGSADRALDHIDYGATALRREVISELPVDRALGLEVVLQQLARERCLRALPCEQRFYEIGSETGIADLERDLPILLSCRPAAPAEHSP